MSGDIEKAALYVKGDEWINPKYLEGLIRFRVGSHSLDICTGRWCNPSTGTRGRVERNYRQCRVCQSGSVEDERHFLLECLRYSSIREQFPDVVGSGGGEMISVMECGSQYRLARLLFELNQGRTAALMEGGYSVV